MQNHSRKCAEPQAGSSPVISLVGSSSAARFEEGDLAMVWAPGTGFHRELCTGKFGFGLQKVRGDGRMTLLEGYTVRMGNEDYFLRAGALARPDGSVAHIALAGGCNGR